MYCCMYVTMETSKIRHYCTYVTMETSKIMHYCTYVTMETSKIHVHAHSFNAHIVL